MSSASGHGAPDGNPGLLRAAGAKAARFHAGLVGLLLLFLISGAMLFAHGASLRTTPAGPARFVPVDVYIDSGARPLAAYQFEFVAKNAQIVGLEGGDSVFKDAPYYDPAALHPSAPSPDERIVVAAFSTAADLPRGNTRIARLHLMMNGMAPDATPATIGETLNKMPRKLLVATDAAGESIDARLTFRQSGLQGDTQ